MMRNVRDFAFCLFTLCNLYLQLNGLPNLSVDFLLQVLLSIYVLVFFVHFSVSKVAPKFCLQSDVRLGSFAGENTVRNHRHTT